MTKQLTGKIDASRIRTLTLPPLPDGVLEGFRALGDATSAVADALDEFGIPGCVASTTLRPTIPGGRLVGRALTVHNIVQSRDPMESARQRVNKMAEIEAHNLAEQGDVIVIQGIRGTSNMGGVGAQIGKRQGEVGAIVDGGIRDVGHSRSVGYPIWSTEITPMSGKWRVETVEINGLVVICGIRVYPGDLVIADDTGVCFVPRADAERVLEYARKKAQSEEESCARVEAGLSVPELAGVKPAAKT